MNSYDVGDLVRIVEATDNSALDGHVGVVLKTDDAQAGWVLVDIRDHDTDGDLQSWWVENEHVEHV